MYARASRTRALGAWLAGRRWGTTKHQAPRSDGYHEMRVRACPTIDDTARRVRAAARTYQQGLALEARGQLTVGAGLDPSIVLLGDRASQRLEAVGVMRST